MNRRFVAKILLYSMAYSVGGLIVCRLIDAVFFRNGVSLDQTIIGLWIIRFLAIIFGITVMSFIPFVFLSRPHVKEVQELWAEEKIDPEQLHPFWKFLFYSNYGNVPKWLYLPFVIIAAILAGIFALSLIVFIGLAAIWLFLHFVILIK
jgi:hypothetical protein